MTVDEQYDVVIVGAGHGGSQAAITLRQAGFGGSIALLSEEAELPYERPPLSKDYLAGTRSSDRILIRPARFWPEKNIDLILATRAIRVDPETKTIHCSDGRAIGYGDLIWAAGGRPRRLTCAGNDLKGVHSVRDRADVDRLRAEIKSCVRIVIVGGGYIGLEVAAALTNAGHAVTLLEAQHRLLARVAGSELSTFFETEHRRHGVDLRLGAVVDCIEGSAGRVCGVRLSDGSILPCDIVVVGIGILPCVELLRDAGADGDNGIHVDASCRTSLPHIYAIGDLAAQHTTFADGRRLRIESVQNAHDQAVAAARSIMGLPLLAPAPPWFWSNQYDLKLQTIGLSVGFDATVVRGDIAMRSFSVVYLDRGRVIALDCVNATRDFVQGRQLVTRRIRIDPTRLADPDIALSEFANPEPETHHA